MNRIYAFLLAAAILVATGLVFAQSPSNAAKMEAEPAKAVLVAASDTPDQSISTSWGPSWIKHLGLTVAKTHMGQMGGSAPEAVTESVKGTASSDLRSLMNRFLGTYRSNQEQGAGILKEEFTASGADLYRWNCRSCHGPEGKGFDPEINSVVGPVQGTSAKMAKDRMIARGIEADDEMVQQMSDLAATSLRDRLHRGGKNMPAFDYLRKDEIEALVGYLEKLAGVPPTERDGLVVKESATRVGEHMVRGTCHICHDATGPGAGLGSGQANIPSLASIPRDHSLSGIVHQVQFGSCATLKLTGGDVMPAYPYFSEEEIAAAYFVAFSAKK